MTFKNYNLAIHLSKINEAKCSRQDNQFAVFRLISSILLLAIFVSLGRNQSLTFGISLGLIFLFYCFLTSVLHKKIQKRVNFWNAIFLSFMQSKARQERNFSYLNENAPPWHKNLAVLPLNHMYASDIDVHENLFLFLNSCSTFGGSAKLFHELISSGVYPCPSNVRNNRIQLAQKFVAMPGFLRRFETFRFSVEQLKNYYKDNDKETEQKEEWTKIDFKTAWKQILYSIFSVLIWILLFVPMFSAFLKTHDVKFILQPILIYALIVLIGISIFDPLLKYAEAIAKSNAFINFIMHQFKKNENQKINLPYSFYEKNAAKKIKTLSIWIDILSLRGNPVFWIFIHIFFPFDAVFSILLFFNLRKVSANYSQWQNEIHDFDFVLSLARLKIENPEFNFFPNTDKNNLQEISFVNLGHPLISFNKRVHNSLILNKSSPLILLTGSNMAGKSTFLRSLATNILLANLGAPVCATQFNIIPTKILCSIRIDDSLSEGTSYFYAEVKRLAEILKIMKQNDAPSLFFIDEIFKGTNNKERYLGGLSLLKAFLELGCFGFVTTHDLSLTQLANENSKLRNMHFCEQLENKQFKFDYLLKDGPCPTTNALEIMKQAGLPVNL